MTEALASEDRPPSKRRWQKGWWLKPILHVIFAMPMVVSVSLLLTGQLGANPIEALMRDLGEFALRLMLITLAITPLAQITGYAPIGRCRRMAGLWAFTYVVVHLLVYLILDQGLHLPSIFTDVVKRNFILVGMIGFLCLLPLAITSTKAMVKRIGAKRWQRLHRLSYWAAAAGLIHYFLFLKADYRTFYVYLIIFAVLMAYRFWRAPKGQMLVMLGIRGSTS